MTGADDPEHIAEREMDGRGLVTLLALGHCAPDLVVNALQHDHRGSARASNSVSAIEPILTRLSEITARRPTFLLIPE
ncbi:hypothetical protein J6590_001136 [Homalodisca vitripennis]|nr:hypothetical protein J6590_001136 [Homalodisca vitripennis]